MQSVSVAKTVCIKPVRCAVSCRGSQNDEIYIGFPKGDYAPRAGRKGRVIKDDPKKYPAKDDAGFFLGVSGGWAGGEAGLWRLREEVAAQETKNNQANAAASKSSGPEKLSANAKDLVYLGFNKDELDLKKTGIKGRVVIDDARKYPGREDVGFIVGATGGFAGGEATLKSDAFEKDGELRLNLDGRPALKRQNSPVTVGFVVLLGGLALTAVLTAGQQIISSVGK